MIKTKKRKEEEEEDGMEECHRNGMKGIEGENRKMEGKKEGKRRKESGNLKGKNEKWERKNKRL